MKIKIKIKMNDNINNNQNHNLTISNIFATVVFKEFNQILPQRVTCSF